MTSEILGWISICLMLLLLVSRIPIAFTLGTLGVVFLWIALGPGPALGTVGVIPYSRIAVFTYTAIPLFIIMGHFASYAGFAADIFDTMRKWVGHIPGGIVQATVVVSAAFGAACGSGIATCAVVSKIVIPEMNRVGVDRRMGYGVVAAAGTLAAMIPPSIIMIMYGIITEQSIAKLLIAGIFPGILSAFTYMVMIFARCKRNPALAPPVKGISWKERFISLKNVWGIALLALIVMGGIYMGVFTPTEAGGIGASAAFLGAIILRRLSWKDLKESLVSAATTVTVIFIMIACVYIFGVFLGISGVPQKISTFLVSLDIPVVVIVILIMIMYIVMGMFMDTAPAFWLTLPIIYPGLMELGVNPIWFGVLIVHIFEVALVSPPYGLNLFVLKGVHNAEMGDIMRGVIPFLAVDIVTLSLLIAFPQIALFLPNTMFSR
jgi:tripartite ATP-independent transporter DctM subunit